MRQLATLMAALFIHAAQAQAQAPLFGTPDPNNRNR